MTPIRLSNLLEALSKATTEEEVKYTYAKYFDLKYDTSARHDLYTPQVFFEFKYINPFKKHGLVHWQ